MDAFSFPSSTVTEAGTAVTWLVPTHRGEGYPPRRTGGLQHAAAALCCVPSDCRHKGRRNRNGNCSCKLFYPNKCSMELFVLMWHKATTPPLLSAGCRTEVESLRIEGKVEVSYKATYCSLEWVQMFTGFIWEIMQPPQTLNKGILLNNLKNHSFLLLCLFVNFTKSAYWKHHFNNFKHLY